MVKRAGKKSLSSNDEWISYCQSLANEKLCTLDINSLKENSKPSLRCSHNFSLTCLPLHIPSPHDFVQNGNTCVRVDTNRRERVRKISWLAENIRRQIYSLFSSTK